MKELGLNNTTLAARMKISRPYVVKVLHGDVNITLGAAARFAKALGMDFVPALVVSQGNDENGKNEGVTANIPEAVGQGGAS